ncbi:hypothetical protein TNIN_494161 [Trichonephila inaurata madagascariensis]|uniref:Uncharacterized protein n=1 Tax=Trichonephila inaurata madagascariensis TaxID=2747483 RepID=A0A8X6KJJ9_9ARAC|nr:hypothetical protein TNIN_494161 [Trichonephila inaurata madagascariensis]
MSVYGVKSQESHEIYAGEHYLSEKYFLEDPMLKGQNWGTRMSAYHCPVEIPRTVHTILAPPQYPYCENSVSSDSMTGIIAFNMGSLPKHGYRT